ncbi:MAG: YdbH domain-containing protein, partial [Kiloniellales bacterium]|nr:YdbH domain-containing protein [Kiloniellales bacterium]
VVVACPPVERGPLGRWVVEAGATHIPIDMRRAPGLAGEGVLGGTLPVVVSNEGLEIKGGHLSATGPGRLSIRSPQAKAILAPYGEQAALLVDALEDFHYSELSLRLDKDVAQDMKAQVSLLGANPNVLEGHPFKLNITLESNIAKISAALFAGYRAAQAALRRAWRAADR